MTRIKICGLTNHDDVQKSIELGADAVGFVFTESSRQISPESACEIIRIVPPFVAKVGVFTNEDIETIEEIIKYCHLDIVQIHGQDEIAKYKKISTPVIIAFRVRDANILNEIKTAGLSFFLMDSYIKEQVGGTGTCFDWSIAVEAKKYGNLILSGGLNHANIKEALETVRPYAVDASSGLEISPGKKDHDKLRQFIKEVRNWDSLTN